MLSASTLARFCETSKNPPLTVQWSSRPPYVPHRERAVRQRGHQGGVIREHTEVALGTGRLDVLDSALEHGFLGRQDGQFERGGGRPFLLAHDGTCPSRAASRRSATSIRDRFPDT